MMLAENELPLFERPAAATGQNSVYVYISFSFFILFLYLCLFICIFLYSKFIVFSFSN